MVDRSSLINVKPQKLELTPIEKDNVRSTSEAYANGMLSHVHDELQRKRERRAKVLGSKK